MSIKPVFVKASTSRTHPINASDAITKRKRDSSQSLDLVRHAATVEPAAAAAEAFECCSPISEVQGAGAWTRSELAAAGNHDGSIRNACQLNINVNVCTRGGVS